MQNFWSQIRVLNVMHCKAELNHISQRKTPRARKISAGTYHFGLEARFGPLFKAGQCRESILREIDVIFAAQHLIHSRINKARIALR